MVKGGDDTVLGVAAVIRDVSARWQREKEKDLMERIRTLEAHQAGWVILPLHSRHACASLYKNLVLWQGASPDKIGHAMEPQELFDET